MKTLGETIRSLRIDKELPLRVVSAYLDIDQAILSKIERGQRIASRELVIKLSKYFEIEEKTLLVAWLSDKVVYEIADEEVGLQALQAAEEMLIYKVNTQKSTEILIARIKNVLKKDGRVAAGWLFGSTASGDSKPDSDVDIMIEFNEKKKYSMFDLLDIANAIEIEIKRKVDLVEKGQLKDFALNSAQKNMVKIYG